MLRLALAVLLLAATSSARADDAFATWPGVDYDPAVPTLEQVLGYAPGSRITRPEDALAYLEALAAHAPERMRIVPYAESWEGRQLVYAIIAAPETMDRLDAVKADIAALADPRRTSQAEAEAIIGRLPGTVWLSYGVHGNEISSTDAALLSAYHLLAAQDATTAKILDNTIVFIDPSQNPDGRARFTHHYEQALGLEPQADRLAAEHDETWPGGRTNHYLFDLNRDWFRISQPETKGRIAAIGEWFPLVLVDAHEMGGDSTYFFAPEAVPYNPHLTPAQKENLKLFGRNHAGYFDRFGIDYFTREVFDAFYPGYGASWPSYYGGIAMTYEQASPRGRVFERYDGSELTYAAAVRNHYVTSISTAEVVADNREKLLTDFYDYRRSAIEEGRRGELRSYLLPRQADQAGADKLARLLARQGVEVGRLEEEARACGRSYAAGSYAIDMAQPEKRRVAVLMAEHVPMSEEFVAEQKRRIAKALPDEIYDITAWSLPMLFNVEAHACDEQVSASAVPVDGNAPLEGSLSNPDASVAFLAPWGEAPAAHLLALALREGLTVKSPDAAFTLEGERYPAGTLIFELAANPEDLPQRLEALAGRTGARVIGVDTSWVTDGPSFGSRRTPVHRAPKIAIAWDDPTQSYSAGNTRFILEGRYGYPMTPIRTDRLKRADLDGYDVLVLPEQSGFRGGYRDSLGEEGAENLRRWVARGGVLVGLGTATRFLAHPEIDLLSIRREDAAKPEDKPSLPEPKEEGRKDPTLPGTLIADEASYKALIDPAEESPDSAPGPILRALTDPDHWMAAGLKDSLYAIVTGSDIYTPAPLDEGVNVARFAGPETLVASGEMWESLTPQYAFKPLAVAEPEGDGFVIAITQGTTTRAYQDGLDLLLLNALFRGPQHADPVP